MNVAPHRIAKSPISRKAHYVLSCLLVATSAAAQSSSLLGAPERREALTLETSSWSFIQVEPPREIRLHDLITVVVNERSQVIAEGEVDRRASSNINAQLQQWIELNGLSLQRAPQAQGDPQVQGKLDSQFRSEAGLEYRDAMKFYIAAEVVDIRPNGNLVLEAHRQVKFNHEVWEASLSGTIRTADVKPDNTVLSEDLAELRIDLRETGHVRDGFRRGWFLRFLDKVKPF
jgi:flagellar L-ring protein precursor FlgH